MEPTDSSPDRLYHEADLAGFYDLENGWGPDFDFCAKLAQEARSVLDLGCGTGELAAALAEGRDVVGVDPAAAMLAIARRRPGGGKVEWIEGDARDLYLGRRFDLILLSGHAFQAFLTPEDQLAALRTIGLHLNPRGRFLFDSRNPTAEAWRNWTAETSRREVTHPTLGTVEAWNDATHDPATGLVTYETHYRVVESGKHLSATSKIKFTPKDELENLISEAGLHVSEWYGDWYGGPCTATSKELIPLGGLLQLARGG